MGTSHVLLGSPVKQKQKPLRIVKNAQASTFTQEHQSGSFCLKYYLPELVENVAQHALQDGKLVCILELDII